jgi:TolB-like protein/Tfp pilus assembly protein PilF
MTDSSKEHSGDSAGILGRLLKKRVFQTLAIYVAIAWGATEILLSVQETLGFPEWVARLSIAAFIAGVPIAVFLAWIHDLKSKLARNLLRSVAVAALLAGVFLVFQQSRAPGPPDGSVAVLPFTDMSPDAGQSWLVAAIAEDLRNTLAQAGPLLIIAAASSDVFHGRAGELEEIREKLNVRHILDGSVRTDGSTLRITANLIDTVTGRHVWSDRYDLPAENFFDVEDRIVDQITGSLSVTLAPEVNEGGTENLAAFEAYWRAFDLEGFDGPMLSLQEAVSIDPDFAWPLVTMAFLYAFQAENGYKTPQQAWDQAAPLLERAAQINADQPDVYFAYGLLNMYWRKYDLAEQNYKRALELNPSFAAVYGAYGVLMRWGLERFEDAMTLHERNVQVDPLDYVANLQLGTSYWFVERLEDAREQYEKAIRLCPECWLAYDSYSGMYGAGMGRADKALDVIYRAFGNIVGEPTPRAMEMAAGWHWHLGDNDVADRYNATIRSIAADTFNSSISQAEQYLETGDLDEARAIAESELQQNPQDPWPLQFLGSMDLDNGDPVSAVARYRKHAPGIFAEPPRLERWHRELSDDLFRFLSAANEIEIIERLLAGFEEIGWMEKRGFGAYPLLFAGRIDEAIEKMRTQNPEGVIDPGICEGLQDVLTYLPSNVDPEDPRLDALIRESCAERQRQLASVRRKMDSGEYRIPDIVQALNREEN